MTGGSDFWEAGWVVGSLAEHSPAACSPPPPHSGKDCPEDADRRKELTVEYSFPYVTATNTQSIHLEGTWIKMGAIFFLFFF